MVTQVGAYRNKRLTAVALTDRVLLIELAVEVELQLVVDLLCLGIETVLTHQRQDSELDRSESCGQAKDRTLVTTLEGFLFVGATDEAEEHTVDTDRGLDDVGYIALTQLGIEVLHLLATELLVTLQIEVRTAVDTLYFLEAKGHLKLDIRSSVGVVRQLLVVVVAVLLVAEAEGLVPAKTQVLPEVEPLELLTRADEELHLLCSNSRIRKMNFRGDDLIAEGLTDLCYTEGYLHYDPSSAH